MRQRVAWVTGASAGAPHRSGSRWLGRLRDGTVLLDRPHEPSARYTLSVTITQGQPGGAAHAMAKAADDALSAAAAQQLAPDAVTSVALHPDFVRTEGGLQFADRFDLSGSQSPEGVGGAIAALADDPNHASLSGRVCTVTELAVRYHIDVTT
jgi:hypothetical protein